MKHADDHLYHGRSSCSDDDLHNVDPAGSLGCARCTALALDRAEADAADAARWRHFAAHAEIVNKARGVYLEVRVMFGRQDDKPADYVDAMIAVAKPAE
jgi:hypothetical protein